jgi:triosephosphate isomerase
MQRVIAGNWKMNGLGASLAEVEALSRRLGGRPPADCEILICPPATLIASMAPLAASTGFALGGQDCHPQISGAHTGDISAEMLKDAGASYVIVGHSERRADHGETDALVRRKAEAAHRAGLAPIICVGETRAEREAGKAERVVGGQLEGSAPSDIPDFVIAYEPVWAIGTGLTPTGADIAAMHAFIRERIRADIRILYGGSVKPSNAAEILSIANVNGALVGGASLKAADFHGIIAAA